MSEVVLRAVEAAFELEPTAPGDRYFDYCLEPYRPRRPPRGKLRSENLLWKSLEVAGQLEAMAPPLRALQAALGRDMVVFGVKHDGARLWWELYVYDPRKEDPRATVAGLREILAPWLRIAPAVHERAPYMMVSFDLDADVLARGSVEELNLYLTGTDEHMGRSYRVRAEGAELTNTYRFLSPKREIDTVLGLLKSSLFVDYADPRTLPEVLIPELFACKKVCVAKKRDKDGVYYSGIDVDQLRWFLERFDYPAALRAFADACAARFDHLYFDVGLDVRQDESGAIVHPKTSFYGTL
ncbi:MAG TPA: hypothetical protein RMH99_26870 [Sandaracinaceae bacterium LLY-WYZ-13_1]|nr:hypothetical protein [Sandaracinaceae bacterium LLY-WYZ-13_1]